MTMALLETGETDIPKSISGETIMQEASHPTLSQPESRSLTGIARTVITPPEGIYCRSWGSATHDIPEGVHRPFFGTCIVFQDADHSTELVLLALDIVILWQDEATKLREAILEKAGLESHQLVLHPSHTHSGPMLTRGDADRPGGHLIEPYLDSLPGLCCGLISKARDSMFEATMSWTYGKCSLGFNRDATDPDNGTPVCGLNLKEKADDTVLVGRVTDSDGAIRGVIVNYACHPVSMGGGNKLLSPDYPGAMREVVEQEYADAICVFLHGPSGDITPRRSYEADVEAADQNGRELGYAALSAMNSMLPPGQLLHYKGIQKSGATLGVWDYIRKSSVNSGISGQTYKIQLPLKDMPSSEEIEAELAACTERPRRARLERDLIMRRVIGDGKMGELYFTIWQIGDLYLIATPTEAYSKFQIAMREKFPETAIAILNASDGYLGYLPEAHDYGTDIYQVGFAFYDKGALEQVIEKSEEAIRAIAS